MSDVRLGIAPGADAVRDAIHVAVVPMTAYGPLQPGQRVGVWDVGVAASEDVVDAVIGVVDPYLTVNVPEGGRFWMCLLPGIVTGNAASLESSSVSRCGCGHRKTD